MADKVKVRQAIGTVDVPLGTQTWMDDGDRVREMCAAGFWHVVERVAGRKARVKGDGGGVGEDRPDGDAGGDEPVRVG